MGGKVTYGSPVIPAGALGLCPWAVLLGGGSGVKLSARKGWWMPTLMNALAQVAQQGQGRCWALVVTM